MRELYMRCMCFAEELQSMAASLLPSSHFDRSSRSSVQQPSPPSLLSSSSLSLSSQTQKLKGKAAQERPNPGILHGLVRLDRNSLLDLIKSCGKRKDLYTAKLIHAHVLNNAMLAKDTCISNALLTMYTKCGAFCEALDVFQNAPSRNIVSWNSLISGYAQLGLGHEALHRFKQMKHETNLSPNAVTFICVLKACSSIRCAEMGEEIYAEVKKKGLLEENIILGNAVLDMYAKCNMLAKAQQVFDELPTRDVVSWNSMITAYNQHGLSNEALKCFRKMQEEAISPDLITYICVLKACSSIKSLRMGEEIYVTATKQSILKDNILFGTALVDMYGKCGRVRDAQEVFDELPMWNVASWTALMAGYVQEGLADEALTCFMKMQKEGFSPDAITFVSVLKACGSAGFLEMGEDIHTEISKQGLLEKDIFLGTALVDMYAKCGVLQKAQEVFHELSMQNVTSCTALMAGYALLGEEKKVFDLFREMVAEGMTPDLVIFVVLLSACSHGGRVEDGRTIFYCTHSFYCSVPAIELNNCMVDLLSGAGHFDQALELIEKVPSSDRLELWLSLLGACQKWTNIELGKWTFQQILELDERCAAAYVCMGNIFAAAGMHKEAKHVLLRETRVQL